MMKFCINMRYFALKMMLFVLQSLGKKPTKKPQGRTSQSQRQSSRSVFDLKMKMLRQKKMILQWKMKIPLLKNETR